MTTQWVLNEVVTITERNIQVIKSRFSSYSEQQLSWKPDSETWSINEIFAHLNAYSAYYHEAFATKVETTRFRTPSESFTSSPLGKSAWLSMKLGNAKNVKRKFSSPKSFNPAINPDLIEPNTVEKLSSKQVELLHLLEKVIEVNIKKVKVPISISKWIRLRLGDALLFVTYHNERHIQQAFNLSKHPKFPKK